MGQIFAVKCRRMMPRLTVRIVHIEYQPVELYDRS